MSNDDSENARKETPWKRIRLFLSRAIPSVAIMLGMTFVLSTIADIYISRTAERILVRQLPEEDYAPTITRLQSASENLKSLSALVADNPKADALLQQALKEVDTSIATLETAPYYERRVSAMPSLFSSAFAQEIKPEKPEPDKTLRGIAYYLIGFVAVVFVVTLIMYGFATDKAKKSFMERTLNQILGFVFGLITGVFSGQLT